MVFSRNIAFFELEVKDCGGGRAEIVLVERGESGEDTWWNSGFVLGGMEENIAIGC